MWRQRQWHHLIGRSRNPCCRHLNYVSICCRRKVIGKFLFAVILLKFMNIWKTTKVWPWPLSLSRSFKVNSLIHFCLHRQKFNLMYKEKCIPYQVMRCTYNTFPIIFGWFLKFCDFWQEIDAFYRKMLRVPRNFIISKCTPSKVLYPSSAHLSRSGTIFEKMQSQIGMIYTSFH